jgi:hypothetical protein
VVTRFGMRKQNPLRHQDPKFEKCLSDRGFLILLKSFRLYPLSHIMSCFYQLKGVKNTPKEDFFMIGSKTRVWRAALLCFIVKIIVP